MAGTRSLYLELIGRVAFLAKVSRERDDKTAHPATIDTPGIINEPRRCTRNL